MDPNSRELVAYKAGKNRVLADMALISFVSILCKIWKSRKCDAYWDNEELNERMPNYWVALGFGLHIGWAIEGAIGSEFKIDATYLSPNVNMSNILEATTKEYGVPLLLTGDLYSYFSELTKKQCWRLDIVRIGHKVHELYTVDVNLDRLSLEEEPRKLSPLG